MRRGLTRLSRLLSIAGGLALLGSISVSSVALAAGPSVSLSPASFNYGTVGVGAQSSAQTFALTNTGTSDLHVGGVTFGGTNPADFRVYLSGCDYHTVAPGTTCTEYVVFAPKEAGALSAALTFPDDAAGSPQTVALTGYASGPVMTFAPASLSFNVPIGQASAPQTFYVRNSGNQPLTITSAAPPYLGTAYLTVVSDGCSGTTIPPGSTCRMIVTFTATQAGSSSATLTFQANTNPAWNNYNAFYNASGPLAQTYTPTNFGYQPQNSTSQQSYVQLQNAGNVAMHVSAVALGGPGASQFAITSDTCTGATIGYGGPCFVYLTFTPTTTGPTSATVSFTDDAPGSPQFATIYGTGIAPGAILSQTAIDFGVVRDAGGSASHLVQVSNPTAQALHVTSAAISVGGGVFHTSADSCTGATILPASSCSVTVTFAPTSSFAVFSGTLAFADDGSPSGQQSVSLAGQGVDPQLTYAPDQINFGNQRQGTRSAAQALTLTNTSSSSWTPQGMQLEGTYYGSYNLDASGCTQALAPGASCQLLVTFAPTGVGLISALLDVVNPVTGSINKVPVSGIGVAPILNQFAYGVDFGNQRVGTTLPGYVIFVANVGSDTLHVSSLSITGANASSFAIGATNCIGAAVAPNTSCFVPLSFAPTATGTFGATLNVVSDAWYGQSAYWLTGTGVQAHATFSPSSVSFPNTATGQSAVQSISVMSDGTATLDMSSITVSGSGAAAYTFSADTCSGQQLPATIGCSVKVTFAPPAVGSYPASLAIADDAAASPQSISLTGNDLQSNATASPSSLSFGGLRPGKTASPQTVTLTNDGNTTVNVTAATLTGDPSFSIAANTCSGAALALGATCTVQVGFAPTTLGPLQGTLSFNDDATNAPQAVAITGSGIQPGASLSTSSLTFGNQAVGSTSPGQSVVLTNSGTDTLNVGAAAVAAPFGIVTDTCSNTAVAPGSTCTIQVAFAPTATGPLTGTLSIPDDAPGSPQGVAMSGTGIYPHATASPTTIAFGDVRVGGRANQTATLTNDGSVPVHVGTVTLTGDLVYGLTADTCSGVTLSVGAACTVQVNFVATNGAPYTLGTLAFNDDAGNSPQTVALSGHAVQPAVSLSPSSLAFGGQLVGTRSANQSVVVTNSGSATLNIGTATAAAPFAIATDGCSNTAVAAGSSCTIQVAFAPTVAGAATSALSIPDDARDSPQTVALSGTGLQPHATASPGAISFGGVRPGKTATAQTVTLTNDGNTAVHVSTATLTGDGSFSLLANTCSGAALAVGGACTVQVGFAPANLGTFNATLTFSDDASNSPQTVAIGGSGVMPAVSLSASSLAFGNQVVGAKSANQAVVVTNTGTGTLNVGAATVGAPFAIAADACSNTAVAPGASCTIQVNFTPAATGSASGTLSIPDDATGSPHTVSLSGTGVQPRATVSPSSLSFGSVHVGPGSPTAQQFVTVTNSGTAALHIASNNFAGNPAFTIGTSCAGATVAPGATCKIGVYASPDTIGARTGTLQISDDAPGSPQTVALSVTGLSGQLTFTPTSFNFGSVHVGIKSSKLNLKVQNTGNAGMTISTVVITGPNASSFGIESTSCANKQLSTGASCSVTVYMKPAVTGPLNASVTFTDDGLGGTQNVALTGTGI